MTDAEIARPLELELQKLFEEDSCQLERRPCTGKYCGHTDYTLVFGSGRRLYIGLDKRNYLNGLWDKLRAMRHFRTHQAENSRRISNALAERDTPFRGAEAEIMPYDDTNDLTLYAVVILSTRCGARFVYRAVDMYGFLVGYDNPYFSFDRCMENLFEDISGSMRHIRALSELEAA